MNTTFSKSGATLKLHAWCEHGCSSFGCLFVVWFSMLLFVLQAVGYINGAAAITKHCALAPLRPDIYPLGCFTPKKIIEVSWYVRDKLAFIKSICKDMLAF